MKLENLYRKNFPWKYIKNESHTPELVNREQETIFPLVSRSDVYFGFAYPFLSAGLSAQVKLHARKIGCDESNLSEPV